MINSPAQSIQSQSLRFIFTGSCVASLFFALSFAFVSFGIPAFISHAFAYLIAFVVGYTAQRAWTFQSRTNHRRAFPRYLALQAACMVGSGVLAHALARFETSPLYMSMTTTCAAALISYFGSSRWVFSEADGNQ
jgi:putative flippase GtrA